MDLSPSPDSERELPTTVEERVRELAFAIERSIPGLPAMLRGVARGAWASFGWLIRLGLFHLIAEKRARRPAAERPPAELVAPPSSLLVAVAFLVSCASAPVEPAPVAAVAPSQAIHAAGMATESLPPYGDVEPALGCQRYHWSFLSQDGAVLVQTDFEVTSLWVSDRAVRVVADFLSTPGALEIEVWCRAEGHWTKPTTRLVGLPVCHPAEDVEIAVTLSERWASTCTERALRFQTTNRRSGDKSPPAWVAWRSC
jgi:hypothetical protein